MPKGCDVQVRGRGIQIPCRVLEVLQPRSVTHGPETAQLTLAAFVRSAWVTAQKSWMSFFCWVVWAGGILVSLRLSGAVVQTV